MPGAVQDASGNWVYGSAPIVNISYPNGSFVCPSDNYRTMIKAAAIKDNLIYGVLNSDNAGCDGANLFKPTSELTSSLKGPDGTGNVCWDSARMSNSFTKMPAAGCPVLTNVGKFKLVSTVM